MGTKGTQFTTFYFSMTDHLEFLSVELQLLL